MEKESRVSIWVGVLVPVCMVLFIAGAVYLPALFVSPSTDFVYGIYNGGGYYYGGTYPFYSVDESGYIKEMTEEEFDKYSYRLGIPDKTRKTGLDEVKKDFKLYYHDIETNESREVTLEEALKYKLDDSAKSPDGFEISRGSRGGGVFPFFYSDGNWDDLYLRGHNLSRKLNIDMPTYKYDSWTYFGFVGWVVE